MPADFLTKRLPREAFERCRVQSGMTSLQAHLDTHAPLRRREGSVVITGASLVTGD